MSAGGSKTSAARDEFVPETPIGDGSARPSGLNRQRSGNGPPCSETGTPGSVKIIGHPSGSVGALGSQARLHLLGERTEILYGPGSRISRRLARSRLESATDRGSPDRGSPPTNDHRRFMKSERESVNASLWCHILCLNWSLLHQRVSHYF